MLFRNLMAFCYILGQKQSKNGKMKRSEKVPPPPAYKAPPVFKPS